MRKLLSVYQLAGIVENNLKTLPMRNRKQLANEVLETVNGNVFPENELELENEVKANVLAKYLWNVQELQKMNLGNAYRRAAMRYGRKS